MSSVTITLEGEERLRRKLRGIPDAARAQLRDAISATALNVQNAAKRNAPVNDGRLRQSIAWRFLTALEAEVGTNVRYAPFIEFGTGPAGRNSNLTDLAERARKALGYEYGPTGGFPPLDAISRWAEKHGLPEEAVFPIALKIYRAGLEAQPFLFPAAEKEAEAHLRRFRAAIRKSLQ